MSFGEDDECTICWKDNKLWHSSSLCQVWKKYMRISGIPGAPTVIVKHAQRKTDKFLVVLDVGDTSIRNMIGRRLLQYRSVSPAHVDAVIRGPLVSKPCAIAGALRNGSGVLLVLVSLVASERPTLWPT
eukprot:6027668-Pyramimonas_sp.AAC.1